MGGFRLRVLNRDIELSDGEYSIGRSRDCDIPVSDDLVSRKHALLLVRNGRASIRDMGSRNGTFLNGNRISMERELTHLDQITVGAHDMMCIEDRRVRERPPLHRCSGCSVVVDPQDVFCRRCGTPIRNSMAFSGQSSGDSPSQPYSMEENEDTQATSAASALAVLGGVATRMMTAENYLGAERVLERALLDLLQETIKTGKRPDDLSLASECALQLAEQLKSDRWVEWTLNVHEACATIPSPTTIDRMTEIVSELPSFDHRPISKLIARVGNAENLSATDKFSVRRLESLKRMCAPR